MLVEIVMLFELKSFQSILLLDSLNYQPSVGLVHFCLGQSSLKTLDYADSNHVLHEQMKTNCKPLY